LIRAHENQNAYLIFDDNIIEKEYTDESEIISWHKTVQNQSAHLFASILAYEVV
jgi:hypothetical protein